MLNKEEIQFNSRALVSAWIGNGDDVSNLTIELSNDDETIKYQSSLNECGDKIGELLFINGGKYKHPQLVGCVSGVTKTIGEIEIV